jgi:hypothetical protein
MRAFLVALATVSLIINAYSPIPAGTTRNSPPSKRR